MSWRTWTGLCAVLVGGAALLAPVSSYYRLTGIFACAQAIDREGSE